MRTPRLNLTRAEWRTSSYSGGQGQCVQIARGGGWAAIRDSKNPSGGALILTSDQLSTFLRANVLQAQRADA
ncbi:DUF397 domain-containing protein [Saccharothrix coeruleofusca]|uniref:DUF397 domain-containing protein n=1 Tax=Saccharothrix coeruleofusca TaxID=33919 RepID=A0A918AHJ3_9PSEU|nr:DUF397 domain-containing protein [Saccharothrix coeruleofusca]GGP37073.1 hypothetical protein GCM10010185_05450 [Saccharothrix coeruleofusca]